ECRRGGGVDTLKGDVSIAAATHADLKALTKEGKFREDLFYRLNVILVPLPALRERKDDIPLLVQHFLGKYTHESRKSSMILTPEAMDRLMAYDWPGTIRDLENVI